MLRPLRLDRICQFGVYSRWTTVREDGPCRCCKLKAIGEYYGQTLRCQRRVEFEVNTSEVVGLLSPAMGPAKPPAFAWRPARLHPQRRHGLVFNGENVTHLPMYQRARLGMGYLSQETSVFRKLNVEQNLLAIMELMPRLRTLGRSLSRKERYERMEKVIDRFGLAKVRKNVAARLSGGEKRRLEIARCLVCEPLLILLDEPFTGIDPITIAEIRQIILELRNEGIGLLLTDHNVHEALKITSRSYLIKEGKVCTHGTPAQIVRDPVAIAEYLGAGFSDTSYRDFDSPEPQAVPTAHTPKAVSPAKQPAAPAQKTLEFPSAPLPPSLSPAQIILEQEKIQRLVENLKTADQTRSAQELVQKGASAVPALLAALERRDAELRQAAVDVLQKILKHTITFDAFALGIEAWQSSSSQSFARRASSTQSGMTIRVLTHDPARSRCLEPGSLRTSARRLTASGSPTGAHKTQVGAVPPKAADLRESARLSPVLNYGDSASSFACFASLSSSSLSFVA